MCPIVSGHGTASVFFFLFINLFSSHDLDIASRDLEIASHDLDIASHDLDIASVTFSRWRLF